MGPALLTIAALLATVALGLAILGRDPRPMLIASVASIWLAIGVLVVALVRVDTSMALVVAHTRPGLGPLRRVMGLWGGSAGSLLLFVAIIGIAVAAVRTEGRLRSIAGPLVIAVLTWASVRVAPPFERLDVPAIEGSGLSPILEHWAMLIHPPLLYAGFALSLVPALLPEGDRRADRIAAVAVAVLTAALALGGRWAYMELGWGGWWAWDPVENAALIPWLLLIVHLHVPAGHALRRWAGLLAWPAVFAGSAMTRTSLRTSVHAFANADGLGWFLWPLTALVGVGAVALGVRTSGRLSWSRRSLPVVLALGTALVVALGTFRPFVPGDATDGTFYSRFLWPVAMIAVLGVGVAPRLGRTSRARLLTTLAAGAAVGATLATWAGWTLWWQIVNAALLGAGVALVVTDLGSRRRTLAHLGLLLVLAGALGGTASTQRTIEFTAGNGERVVDGHTIQLVGVGLVDDDPPVIEAEVLVDGQSLAPQLTVYTDRALRLPELAAKQNPLEDVQLILRSADDDGSAVLTINVEPLAGLVWIGAAMMTLGVLLPRRVRARRAAVAS